MTLVWPRLAYRLTAPAPCGCAGKPGTSCDDGKPCTIDLCDAKLACQQVPISGQPCAPGKACALGVCL